MKGNIVATVGISCSGKSTWAHGQWSENPEKIIVVERDGIRNLLFGYNDANISQYYKRKDLNKLEKEVSRYQDTLIYEGLEQEKTVILSNTHLDRKRDLESLKYWNVPVEIKVFPILLKEALTRDMGRNRKVGEEVITKQYNRFVNLYKGLEENPIDFTPICMKQNSYLKPCWVVDIDGTLAHKGDRSPFDWKRVKEDSLDTSVAALIQQLNDLDVEYKPTIIICTGRDGVCKKETADWLNENLIDFDKMYTRAVGDNRPDWIVKEEMWREISKKYNILGLVDDRLQVCRRARMLGLKVFNVEHNNF